ncbi:MAG: hypothetical protein SGJ09_15585 [Phycisphaerae bacterium]|nr:hypothetical protein [Phycisphaerae bacterium]
MFIFDGDHRLQYRGAINDQYGLTYARPYPRSNYLRSVLDAVLRGDEPLVSSTVVPGCAIAMRTIPSATPTSTYHEHIAPLVAQHCLECHWRGGPAPFRLETYEQVAAKAAMIRQVVADGLMPPWSAARPPDGQRLIFANDRSLDDAERARFIRWVDEGTAQGDIAKATPYPRPKPIDGWQIGTPDLALQIPEAKLIPAEGALPYVMPSANATSIGRKSRARLLSTLEVSVAQRTGRSELMGRAAISQRTRLEMRRCAIPMEWIEGKVDGADLAIVLGGWGTALVPR